MAKKWDSPIYRDVSHGDSGYPVLAILNRFVASPAASTKADIGPPAVISNVESPAPARTWTYRVGIMGTRRNTASTILRSRTHASSLAASRAKGSHCLRLSNLEIRRQQIMHQR